MGENAKRFVCTPGFSLLSFLTGSPCQDTLLLVDWLTKGGIGITPPHRGEPQAERAEGDPRDLQRRRILDAAIGVFSWKGYVSSTVSDIAEQAGLSHGLVHHYFDSKANLFAAAVEEGLGYLQSVRQAAFSAPQPPEPLLRRWALGLSLIQEQGFLYSRLVMQVLGAPGMHPQDCMQRLLRFMTEEIAVLAEMLVRAGHPPDRAAERAQFALSVLFGQRLIGLWHMDAAIQHRCGFGLYQRTCGILQIPASPAPEPSEFPSCPCGLRIADTGWGPLLDRVTADLPAAPMPKDEGEG